MKIKIAGVDEVGRGPLAGPVVAAAVVYPAEYSHPEIKDSKKLSRKMRDKVVGEILGDCLDWCLVVVGPRQIDALNIRQATHLAMTLALRGVQADRVLVDGNMAIETELPQETVIQGDSKHVEISGASILAKVWRDRHMQALDEIYPGYGFPQHAGYGTETHRAAIARLGPSNLHRFSFAGVKEHRRGDQTESEDFYCETPLSLSRGATPDPFHWCHWSAWEAGRKRSSAALAA